MLPARKRPPRLTVEEYLQRERVSDERHVYLDGEVWMMAGESPFHGDITTNLVGQLYLQLDGTPCRARVHNTKVRSGPAGPRPFNSTSGLYSYPDVLVVCGEVEYLDDKQDVLTNPTVILEVLSPSTEVFDRKEKLARFTRWNPTLTDYLLVSQDQPRVERYRRQADGSWAWIEYDGLEAVCELEAIGCRLPLARVYARVTFPPADDEVADPPPPAE